MARPRLGKLVWPGAILAGLALGGFVILSWPDPTTRTVKLPYGESSPKTPFEVATTQPTTVSASPQPTAASTDVSPPESASVAEEPTRVLAAAERDSNSVGPDPVPSQLELQPGYRQDPPEALGAEPLPGADLRPGPPPVAR